MKLGRLLSAVIALSIVGILLGINQFKTPEHLQRSKIVGLPDHYDTPLTYSSYSGPHPSAIQRPDETFPFPIKIGETGPVQPLFAGDMEYPFLCQLEESELGQPLVDNQQGVGVKVFKEDDKGNKTPELLGFSKDCSMPTQVIYMYLNADDGHFYTADEMDGEVEIIEIDGKPVEFIVRVEVGTINRHIYMLYALKGENDTLEKAATNLWNNKLIYQFKGGVGIGKRQGKLKIKSLLENRKEQLAAGYAIAHSTANRTSNHYNIWLSEDTALRVKKQFIARYGVPEYTVGLGGSGGAIQQYLLAQNHPGIIDAAVALYSYPDMLSQTTYVLDCELLEYFFDYTDVDNPTWSNWESRSLLQGMNALDDRLSEYTLVKAAADLLHLRWPQISLGATECTESWRGLAPLIMNPHFPAFPERIDKKLRGKVQLSYWDNMKVFYGTDEHGYARRTWDNVGVQYGLSAMTSGQISVETFLKLNASIGGWKHSREMEREYLWFYSDDFWPERFSIWSHHNATSIDAAEGEVALRHEADIKAIEAAYRSGQVFLGKIDIPVIDLRHYLDEELDMHHSFTSFSTRSRMIKAQGHADNQMMWMTMRPYTPIQPALELMDEWMQNIKQSENKSVVLNRPEAALDQCHNSEGDLIARGTGVWDGQWNGQATGQCLDVYPHYQTSRMIAGDNISGDIFKCQLQPVEKAIEAGLYGSVNMNTHLQRLKAIFPQGVCDYSLPDMGRPDDLYNHLPTRLTGQPAGQLPGHLSGDSRQMLSSPNSSNKNLKI